MNNYFRIKVVDSPPYIRVKGLSKKDAGLTMDFFVRFESGNPIKWPLNAGTATYIALKDNDITSITALKNFGITVSYVNAYGNRYAYIQDSSVTGFDIEFLKIFDPDGADVTGTAKLTRAYGMTIMDNPSVGFSSNTYKYPVYTVRVKFTPKQ